MTDIGLLLAQDIQYLRGVGPKRAEVLRSECDINTFRDLLFYLPYKYVSYSPQVNILTFKNAIYHADICDNLSNSYVCLVGQVLNIREVKNGKKKILKATFADATDFVELVWFSGIRAIKSYLREHTYYNIIGKPQVYKGEVSFSHPEIELIEGTENHLREGLMSRYSLSEKAKKRGISSKVIQGLVGQVFDLLPTMEESLPEYLKRDYQLCDLRLSLREAHFPQSKIALDKAIYRLKFEELFYLQLKVQRTALDEHRKLEGFRLNRIGEYFMEFYNHRLKFELTGAQKRVLKEIRKDVASGRQMNRLLQGDVGSGKTIVALLASLIAADNHLQVCVLAPTEILAEQHYKEFAELLEGTSLNVCLLTGSVKGKERAKILEGLENGNVHMVVGTHALLQPTVRFFNLGMAVIDEQHRFGVEQRAQLWRKNATPPHILIMSATPIPRTLAMTVYSDLDVSVIDELPPGRKEIVTKHYALDRLSSICPFLKKQLEEGRQIYVIYPLIKESEKSDLLDTEQGYKTFTELFPQYRVGMIHGQVQNIEKEEIFQEFKRNKLQILVATTVIEVGVNVPNASVIIIMNAERFGLSQLHQLRGRVGRGNTQSYCLLMTKQKIAEHTKERMDIMCSTTDGFRLAEEDLRLRGPGDIEGTQQSGVAFNLKVANVMQDVAILERARDAAKRVVKEDPDNRLQKNLFLRRTLERIAQLKTDYSLIS